MSELQLVLVDPNPTLRAEWRAHFAELPNVEIVNGYFETVQEFDCMAGAANPFGLMDGAIMRFFGSHLMRRVMERIIRDYLGEQPIGTSMIVETDHPNHTYIAHTPTMRIPMAISRTDYVYTAMWAMLLAVHQHNQIQEQDGNNTHPIRIIACPGLGTATGRMPFAKAARQMALAYRHFLNPPERITWQFASARQDAVRRGGDFGFMVR